VFVNRPLSREVVKLLTMALLLSREKPGKRWLLRMLLVQLLAHDDCISNHGFYQRKIPIFSARQHIAYMFVVLYVIARLYVTCESYKNGWS